MKIAGYKAKHGKLWYDVFIKEVILFLKKISIKLRNEKNKEKKKLFLDLENFNKTTFDNSLDFSTRKDIIINNLNHSTMRI